MKLRQNLLSILILLFSVIGPTQQLQAWLEVKEPPASQRPLPEDSDYFYDEYVEYEENSTSNMNQHQLLLSKPLQQHHQFSATSTSIPTTTNNIPTIPPGVLSHFIPGDTPTLYASTKPPPAHITAEESKQPPTQPATAFTFFGVPIPHINIGKYLFIVFCFEIYKLK